MGNINTNRYIKDYNSIFEMYEDDSKEMTNSLENLKKEGASSIFIDTFKKAVYQNVNSNNRREAYAKIRFTYKSQLHKLMIQRIENYEKLKALVK